MMFTGIIVGLGTFLLIGAFHPLVVQAERRLGVKSWWGFLALGVASLVGSVLVKSIVVSALLGVLGFIALWSIHEVFQQVKRASRARQSH